MLTNQDLNIKIEKIIDHKWLRNDIIRFLCKWDDFPNEDATYRTVDNFKSSPYDIQLVKMYILNFGECSNELRAWILHTNWIRKEIQDEWRKCGEVIMDFSSVLHIHIDV